MGTPTLMLAATAIAQSGYCYRARAINTAGSASSNPAILTVQLSIVAPEELIPPKFEISGGNVNFTVQRSVVGRGYQLQYSDTMAGGTWQNLGLRRVGDGGNLVISTPYVAGVPRRFYRLQLD